MFNNIKKSSIQIILLGSIILLCKLKLEGYLISSYEKSLFLKGYGVTLALAFWSRTEEGDLFLSFDLNGQERIHFEELREFFTYFLITGMCMIIL